MSLHLFPGQRPMAGAMAVRALAGLALCAGAAFQSHAATFTGTAALANDYVWRGSSQTQGDAAVQAGFKASAGPGWYASVWGSNVEFAPETHASSELDFVAGWSGGLADDWALDVNLTHYRYPSTTVDLNWTELNSTLTWKQNYWLQVAYSPDALATGERGVYAQLGGRLPVSDTVRLEAAVGHYWLEEAYNERYTHGQLSGIWAFKAPFELRVTAHATDSAAKRLFPDQAGSRIEAALQASF
ncbi:hypothetical protein A9K58_13465 [Stenotrophomonas maltophilia]|uniref:Uncharacterized protein n=1 Tax=Stenotrophomonas maltophilia TaxID=40324 RepID=A0A1A6XTU5_STEMA|nr:TorF family putative porin [Stenotrophomonas maltophilia]OBU66130.1 hypothetical protein A9K58_13465 [Stenotrophomonas maltophilia]